MEEQVATTPSIIPFLILMTGLLILLCLILFSRRTGHAENLELPQVISGASHEELKILNGAEKWAWWQAMSKKDPFFEYKMPISFYGRVLDETGVPVSGVKIRFTVTDLSAVGTSRYDTESDSAGLFLLEGAMGKGLTVQVSKEGYKHYFTKNRFIFEYAMFADPKYHEPDRAKPVVFVLRKNREAEPLIVRENQEAELMPGQTKSFSIGLNGAAVIIERLADASSGPDGWSARVSVPGGGVALATDEFPFEAPQEGYTSSLDITSTTEKPPVWQGDNGAVLILIGIIGEK